MLYTPLKRRTTLNTLVGAVPGALPPVIGWCAVTGRLDPQALALFAILFLWQVPHFLAIAWMYRDEYARAGLLMLPVVDPAGGMTSRQMLAYCSALIPVSLLPVLWLNSSWFYAAGALLLGLGFFGTALALHSPSRAARPQARRVCCASLIYLPLLLSLLLLDRVFG